MSNVIKNYLDYAGLQAYDTLIKAWANTSSQIAYKTVEKSTDGNSLLFFKKPNAVVGTDTPDKSITLGSEDAKAQLEALADIVGATYDATTGTYSLALDAGFGANTDTVVEALNELKQQIESLNTDIGIASVNAGVVTLKTGIVETAGLISNGTSTAPATEVEGYLYQGEFYSDAEHETKITGEANKTYIDLGDNNKKYVWTGKAYVTIYSDITLAKVATTGAAADVSYNATIEETVVTNVDGALGALATAIGNAIDASEVTCETSDGTSGSDTLKTYSFYQGVLTGDTPEQKVAKKIVDITIPKDYLVRNAEVKTVTAADKAEGGIFENNDDFQVGDKYIDFTVNTADGSGSGTEKHIYINVDDLMEAISVAPNATEVQLAFSDSNVLSASIVDVSGTKITYKDAADATYTQVTGADTFDENATYYTRSGESEPYTYTVDSTVDADNFATKIAAGLYIQATPAVARESVTAALTRLDGNDSTAGSVAKKIKDAIQALDTSTDVGIVSEDATAGTVTIAGSIAETDGVITSGTGDGLTIGAIANEDISGLFS